MAIDRIDRRTLLKGLGAATGLATGFFNSPVARGQTTAAPTRVLLVALHHGWGRDPDYDSFISGSETNFTLPPPLTRLDAIKEHCVFVDGVRGTLWGNAHDVSYSDIFTASVPWGETSSAQLGSVFPEPTGPSLDHIIAEHHDSQVLRVSNRYRSWGRRSHPLCFDRSARELPSFTTPRSAYDSIIGPIRAAAVPSMGPAPGRQAVRNSLFSFLGRDTDRLLSRVSGTERVKLEGYLESVNALGDRILSVPPSVDIDPGEIPGRPGNNNTYEVDLDHYFDMIRLVFRADTHRVAVLGLGQQAQGWTWTDTGGQNRTGNIWGSDFHHEVAHHMTGGRNARLAYEGWVDWYVRKIVDFVQSLAIIPDVDGRTLLDNTVIMLTGEVGSGEHETRDKLHILIGGGGGLQGGRWLPTDKVPARNRGGAFIGGETRSGRRVEADFNYGNPFALNHTADLLVSVGRLAGVPLETIGLPTNNLAPIAL